MTADNMPECQNPDFTRPDIVFSEQDVVVSRMAICNECEHYVAKTTQCTQCGCTMSLHIKVSNSICPLGKWEQ